MHFSFLRNDFSRYPSRPQSGGVSASAGSYFNQNNSTNVQSVSTYSGLFGPFGGGSSGFGFGEGGSFGSFGRAGGDTIKSDYDQERLLQQLLHSEALHSRVKKGAAFGVDLLTPWQWPDRLKKPKIPVWPAELRSFKDVYEGEFAVGDYPVFIPTVDEIIDVSGSR